MKFQKFTIKNYKGIPEIVLDLNKKPGSNIFTLVGLNESGKTSILEAVYMFQKKIEKENAHTYIPKSKQHGFTDSITIVAELELSENEIKDIYEFLKKKYKFILNLKNSTSLIKITKEIKFENSIPVENEDNDWNQTLWTTNFIGKTKQSVNDKNLIEWKKDAWHTLIKKIKNDYIPKILYYPDFLFKFPEKIYLEEYQGEGLEQEEYRGVVQDILCSIDKKFTIEDGLLERMKNQNKSSYKEALNQLLLKMSAKLDQDVISEWDDIFGSGQKKEVSITWDSELVTESQLQRYYIELKIKQGSDSYSINDRSLGFRWFFSFLIFTSFRKSRSTDPGETLFLLDEPASNLHQRSQSKLLQSLDKIVSNCKLIYSTHSHHLINPKWLSGTYIVRNKAINYGNPEESSSTETDISATLYKNFVAKYPDEQDHYKPILDSLDYMPSKLEVVPFTIFTEGKNDYYTFKYFSDVLLKNKYELHFYPGAGVDKYLDVFRLYLAWDRKFIAIFDSDVAGRKAKEMYISKIGFDIEDKIFLLSDIDKKWKNYVTENFFTDNEKLKITQSSFNDHKKECGYDKSRFNTALQQLYIDNEEFTFNKVTVDQFKKIFEFIKSKLEK